MMMMTGFTNTQLTLDDIPAVSKVQFSELHPKYKWLYLLSTLLVLSIVIIPLMLFLIFVNIEPVHYLIWLSISLVVIVSFITSFFMAKARLYAMREHDVLFQHGLFWKKTTAVAFNRIQHIDLTYGPVERKYQIASLKFFTAGGSSVDLKIPGLPEENAEQIRALILSKINQYEALTDHKKSTSQPGG
jgi:membrane protein YdbS with pleckstrin-like domain